MDYFLLTFQLLPNRTFLFWQKRTFSRCPNKEVERGLFTEKMYLRENRCIRINEGRSVNHFDLVVFF